ncbi:MAG: hypothetical protein AAGM22_25990 [Acidobacteriota bacterium]
MFFMANHPDYGTELWVSDGTAEGTRVSFDGWPGALSGFGDSARQVVAAGDQLFILASSQLWVISGNPTSVPEALWVPGLRPAASFVGALGDRALLVGIRDGLYEPWISDGTVAGTFALTDLLGASGVS